MGSKRDDRIIALSSEKYETPIERQTLKRPVYWGFCL